MHAHGASLAVSICICTYNRERLLRQTLARLERCLVPDDVRLEIVVIDNNSTDGTAGVIEDAAKRLPIRTAKETRPGIAPARNAAVAKARGELLLWIDDDVLVEADWITSVRRRRANESGGGDFRRSRSPVLRGDPAAAGCWSSFPKCAQAYALRDFPEGLSGTRRGSPAVRRKLRHQAQHPRPGRLRPDPRPGGRRRWLPQGGVDILRGRDAAGLLGRWIPDCPVLHVIPVERQTTRYLRQYYTLSGATPAATAETAPMLFGRPRWRWREWMENEMKFVLLRYTSRPSRWFGHLKRASVRPGRSLRSPPAVTRAEQGSPGREAAIGKLGQLVRDAIGAVVPRGSRVALLDFPEYGNVGDSVIWLAQLAALRAAGASVVYVAGVSSYDARELRRAAQSHRRCRAPLGRRQLR